MKKNLKIWITSSLLGIFFGCSSAPKITPTATENHDPFSLKQVLSYPNPYQLYSSSYSSFSFESTSTLSNPSDNAPKAHSLFKRTDNGDYLLSRTPLYSGNLLEIRSIGGKIYIKNSSKDAYVRTRKQIEFEKWNEQVFKEVLSTFVSAGFQEVEKGALKDSLICYNKSEGSLCTDPNTGLPVRGSITSDLKDATSLHIDFRLDLIADKTFAIPIP